jgi:predicted short-subunit dehydrogenase-like oxidoreductase (DUF2520 family)
MLSSAIIGSGNLAHHLVQAMLNANIDLKGIWARDTDKAKEMGQLYGVPVFNALNQIPQETDLVLLAISDGAIEQLANGIQTHGIIAHCSGILPVASLGSKQHCGVFWPVQTFSKNQKIDFKKVPVVVQATDEEDQRILEVFADLIAAQAIICKESQRQMLHLAAVFVNNFSNHLFALTKDLLQSNELPFEVLKPLIQETAHKIIEMDPALAQTGPAKRGDTISLNIHRNLLKDDAQLLKLYNILTESIQNKS